MTDSKHLQLLKLQNQESKIIVKALTQKCMEVCLKT
jgi:hypothetical protein